MMEEAIDEASKKMEEMLKNSRESHTGVKLEVNEKLIDSCTTLMNAIRLLVQRAKGLQKEIVAQGKVRESRAFIM
jgi:huntingtin interacting protein 1